MELPDTWKEIAPPYAADGRWWRIYQDGDLDKVIDEALAGNSDLTVAVARVDEARGLLGEANSFLFPQVDAQAGVEPPADLDAHRDFVSRACRANTPTTARR